ncbi:MAG: hypothetical protein DRI24_21775 [Deltaproteobacteria bacterium]|nr:MAG: hypothetical protein DRI24_21775 [Deltaproteobacteria bacterium]
MPSFIECESLSINYNIMGIATINYTIISDTPDPSIHPIIVADGVIFNGIITSVYTQPIAKTEFAENGPWYTTSVSMVATS